MQALEARVAHLENLVEGLQDSVHRETDRYGKLIAESRLRFSLERWGRPSPRTPVAAGSRRTRSRSPSRVGNDLHVAERA